LLINGAIDIPHPATTEQVLKLKTIGDDFVQGIT